MSRATANAPLSTRAARERLAARHQPYWREIEGGSALGYRKGLRGGVWLVRVADPTAGGGYRQASLAKADDALPADGTKVLDYRQADKAAREWVARHHRVAAGLEPEPSKAPATPYTVADAIRDHLADLQARGSRGLSQTRAAAEAHIIPALGAMAVGRLSREKVRGWFRGVAAAPARLRSKPGAAPRLREVDPGDEEATRRRRATANRLLTILKAALNHARHEGHVTCSPDAWHLVKPFRNADAPKVRYLSDEEAVRLVNACPGDFRTIVTAALLTGCRYGELIAMKRGDLDLAAGSIHIPRSKSGKARHVVLTPEGVEFFRNTVIGKPSNALLFERDAIAKQATKERPAEMRRTPWRRSDQFRPMADACKAASISPAVSFHILRHTHASRLAMRGVPLGVIAAQLGHADTRMTERHYAHLAPSYVADTIRASFGHLGIGGPAASAGNVTAFSSARKGSA